MVARQRGEPGQRDAVTPRATREERRREAELRKAACEFAGIWRRWAKDPQRWRHERDTAAEALESAAVRLFPNARGPRRKPAPPESGERISIFDVGREGYRRARSEDEGGNE